MQDDSQRPIIIRRRKAQAAGAHGGAWKIAYADFVTAMMAFFLLMWLLGSTTKGELDGIASYFKNPMRVSQKGGSTSGDSSSLIRGGGKDVTRHDGQLNRGQTRELKRQVDLKSAKAAVEKDEMARLTELKQRIEEVIEQSPTLQLYRRQLLIDITTEGLRIQIVDEQNRPMFELGRARLLPHTRDILHEIGRVLNEVPNRVSLSGHTDATPYPGGERGYSNWELSADRANASRRELVAGGMQEDKLVRVVGLSSAVLFDRQDPYNPINRRISIIVMNKQAEEAVIGEGRKVDVDAGAPLDPASLVQPDAAPGATQ